PMIRVRVLRLGTDDHVIVVVTHHIAMDAWSRRLFFSELLESYNAFSEDRKPVLPLLELQYADFAAWQRKTVSEPSVDGQLRYWLDQLAGMDPAILPRDPGAEGDVRTCGCIRFSIP